MYNATGWKGGASIKLSFQDLTPHVPPPCIISHLAKFPRWKEEVLLHDGGKIIVKRWQRLGGSYRPT